MNKEQLERELRAAQQRIAELETMRVAEKLQAEERWRFALEGTGDGVWDWNVQTNRVFFSRGWKAMLGYEEDEIGDSLDEWASRVHPDDLASAREKVNAHLLGKMPHYESEHRVRCKDGSYKWILNRGKVMEWTDDRKPLRVIGTHKEITEQRNAEERLRQSERHYHSLVDALDVSLCRWLPDTTLTYANEHYKKLFGVEGDPIGQQWITFLPEATRASTAAFYAEIAEHPRSVTYEYTVTMEDEGVREYQWTDTPILDEYGKVLEFQSVGIDVTERMYANTLIAAQRELGRLSSAGLSKEEVWKACLQTAESVSRLDCGGIYLFDEDQHSLTLVYHNGLSADFVSAVTTFGKETSNIQLVMQRKPIYFSAAEVSVQSRNLAEGLRSLAVIPIEYQGRILGCINIGSHSLPTVPEDARRALDTVAMEIGNVIIHQQTTEALQASRKQLNQALLAARMGTWRWHIPTNRMEWSPEATQIFGIDSGQNNFSKVLEQIHPDDRARLSKSIQEAFAEKRTLQLEYHMLDANGQIVWVTTYGNIEYDADGTPLTVTGLIQDITERKQAEAQNRKLSQVVEQSPATVVITGLDGRIEYVNPQFCRITGYSVQEAIGQNPRILKSEHTSTEKYKTLWNTITAGHVWRGEFLNKKKNGDLYWEWATIAPMFDAKGAIINFLAVKEDITARKKAQQELLDLNRTLEERVRERTAQVQDLYDNAPVGYHSLDAEGRLIAINQTELSWLGYAREELLGQPITSIHTAQTAEVFRATFAHFKATGHLSNQEAEVVRSDGTTFPVMISAAAIYNEHGQYVSSRSSMTDITERKQAENELKRTVNFINALLNAIPTPVFYKDKDGLYQGCNHAFVEIIGKTAEHIRGKTVYELWPSAHAELYHQKDLELMQTGGRQVYEATVTDKDGNMRPVIFVKDIFYDESGGVAGLVGAFVDITERKRVEETVQMANAELQRAMRIKDEFLASMSHELRTPLNAILGLSQSMIEQFIGPLNERQLRSMHTIDTSGRHLLELINDILDLSKVSAHQMTLELAPVVVSELCDASLLFVHEAAHTKDLQVTSVVDPAVKYMQADERRLKQILVNLLSNAVKFTPEGGAIELRVTGSIEQQVVRFSVSDTGIGIAPEHIERLFQPFVQLDSGLNRQFEGTGLGLSLVARMTELHGGSVSVESTPGRGSTFTISLPWINAARSPAAAEDQLRAPAPATASAVPHGRKTPLILIAEDNESNSTMLSTYLQAKGYQLAIARNGEEALNHARAKCPDLILMDLQMPVLDGLEATRRLRGESDPRIAHIPVLALTALAMPADRRRALEAGANDYLSKPVNLQQLTDLINRLTEEQFYDRKDSDPR